MKSSFQIRSVVLVAFSRPRGECRYWGDVDVVGRGRWDSRAGLRCFFFLFFSSSPIVAIMERPVRGNGQTKPTRRLEEELAMVVEDVREIERRDGVEVGMDSAQE